MSRLEHPLSQEELMTYADGQMEAQQAAAAAQHLKGCSECSAVVNDVKQLSTQLGAWQVEECPDALVQCLQAEVRVMRMKGNTLNRSNTGGRFDEAWYTALAALLRSWFC